MTPKFEGITVFDLTVVKHYFEILSTIDVTVFLNFKKDRNSKLFGIVTVCHKYDYFRKFWVCSKVK